MRCPRRAAPRVKPAGQHHHVGDQAAERQSQSQQGVDGDKLPETLVAEQAIKPRARSVLPKPMMAREE